MQLLERANPYPTSSTRAGDMTAKEEMAAFDARENEDLAKYKQEKKIGDNSHRGKHKKNISESLQRPDFFKGKTLFLNFLAR